VCTQQNLHYCFSSSGHSHKGPSIKVVRTDGEGGLVKCGHLRTEGEGVKDLADVHKMALFRNVSACFADTPYG